MCIKVYELDPANFLMAPGLAWQACLKKTGVRLEILTDANMLLMVEEGTRGGMCHAVHRYAKANNKYMKNYDKDKKSSFREYLGANNLHGWAMSEKLLVKNFVWMRNVSKIDKEMLNFFLMWTLNILKNYMAYIAIYHFYQKIMKTNKCNKLVCNL